MREVWKSIPDYPYHQASNLGRIRSISRLTSHGRKWKGKILKPWGTECSVNLVGGRSTSASVGHLVLRAFKGRPPVGHECRHLGADPWQNEPDNLVWSTKKQSEETKAKLSAAMKGRSSPMKGRKHSLATRLKIGAARKGRKLSVEHKAKIGAASKGKRPWNKGRPHTEETKAKISAATKGKPPWNKGRLHTEETKAKISAALRVQKRAKLAE